MLTNLTDEIYLFRTGSRPSFNSQTKEIVWHLII